MRRVSPEEQFDEITRGTVDLHVAEELRKKLNRSAETGKPLIIKAGFDPNRPDLHLGHSLLLTRMRRFQEFGHHVIFMIGDFTALIGDPSGKNVTRPTLTRDEVKANALTYQAQVFKILEAAETEVRFNSEWLDTLGTEGLIRLASRYSVARMLERDDFKTRFKEGRSIALHEFLYPLLQGYDSVALKADVELGATDQLFNLLVGRQLMKDYGLEPQVIMTGPLLEGLDGKEKMSKSLDNYVGLSESAEQMFGKLMSITDALLWRYYNLLSQRSLPEIQALKAKVDAGEEHPKVAKIAFAQEIVARFHSALAATEVADAFEKRFSKKAIDVDSLPWVTLKLEGQAAMFLTKAIADAQLAQSNTEARKLISQGGVRLNQVKVDDPKVQIGPGEYVLQVGKLKAARLRLQ